MLGEETRVEIGFVGRDAGAPEALSCRRDTGMDGVHWAGWAGGAGREISPARPFLPILPSGVSRDGGRVFEFLGLIMADDVLEHLRQIAVEDLREPVRREIDPVIGDSVLREIVG